MTTWNYRLVRFRDDSEPGGWFLKLCEVYWDDRGNPRAYAERGAVVCGADVDECTRVWAMMKVALERPPINEDAIVTRGPDGTLFRMDGKPIS